MYVSFWFVPVVHSSSIFFIIHVEKSDSGWKFVLTNSNKGKLEIYIRGLLKIYGRFFRCVPSANRCSSRQPSLRRMFPPEQRLTLRTCRYRRQLPRPRRLTCWTTRVGVSTTFRRTVLAEFRTVLAHRPDSHRICPETRPFRKFRFFPALFSTRISQCHQEKRKNSWCVTAFPPLSLGDYFADTAYVLSQSQTPNNRG